MAGKAPGSVDSHAGAGVISGVGVQATWSYAVGQQPIWLCEAMPLRDAHGHRSPRRRSPALGRGPIAYCNERDRCSPYLQTGSDEARSACTVSGPAAGIFWRNTMAWTTPTLVEICIGLEINGYLPAEF
jgi:coenzyme PQQ precursor peptide PqqA